MGAADRRCALGTIGREAGMTLGVIIEHVAVVAMERSANETRNRGSRSRKTSGCREQEIPNSCEFGYGGRSRSQFAAGPKLLGVCVPAERSGVYSEEEIRLRVVFKNLKSD